MIPKIHITVKVSIFKAEVTKNEMSLRAKVQKATHQEVDQVHPHLTERLTDIKIGTDLPERGKKKVIIKDHPPIVVHIVHNLKDAETIISKDSMIMVVNTLHI